VADQPGAAASFVVLGDGRVVVGDAELGFDPAPLVAAVAMAPPFRAEAVRRPDSRWAVGARRIETVELATDPGGQHVELVWDGQERSVRIDDSPTLASVPELERLGAARSPAYVVTATRLAGRTWEVSVTPL
jgi:hypothetical protein